MTCRCNDLRPMTASGRPVWIPFSCGCSEQFGQPDEVVGCHCEGELESQACGAAQHRPGKPADRFGPAERLLGSLALLLTDCVTGVTRCAGVDGRAAVGRVLGGVT